MSPGKKTGTVPKQKKCTNKVSTPQKPSTSTPIQTENESGDSQNTPETVPILKTELRRDRGIEISWPRKGGVLVPLLESSEAPSDIDQPCSGQSGPPYFSVLESYRQFAPRLNRDITPSLNMMSDIESGQSSTSNTSSWQVIHQKTLPDKEKNKTSNVTSLESSMASGSQELTPQVLEARDEQLSWQHARIEKEIQDLLKKTVKIQILGGPVDEFNILSVGMTRSSTAKPDVPESETDDLDASPPPPLSDDLANEYKAKQDLVDELHAKAAYYGAMANDWTGEVLFPDAQDNGEERPPSVDATDLCEDETLPSCAPNVVESQTSQHGDDEINICHHNQHRKPDNIGLSLGFQKEHSRELDRKMAAIKEMHVVLNQVRGMRARGELVPSSHFEQMAELANETRFQTHPDMTAQEHVPDLLPNCRNDLLNNEGRPTSLTQRSHPSTSASSSEQNVSRLRQETSEVSALIDHGQSTNLQTDRPNREILQNYDSRVLDTELRPSTHEDRRVAQVDLEHKKKILEELMRKDQGLISAANQDNKTTQDKASAQLFTRHSGDRSSSAAEQDASPRNSREEGLDDPLFSQVEPGAWGSSISRVMEQWLTDGRVCLGAESRPTHSPVYSNYHRNQQERRHTNQSRDSCSEDNLRNLNVAPTVANRHPSQPKSPQTNAASQFSPRNVPNAASDDSNTILILQHHIQKLERQLQNVIVKDEVGQYMPIPNPNLAASNVGRGIPQVMPPIGMPHPGTDQFYQQMLAASQLQHSQLLAMSMNYCHQTIWQQQQELSRLSAVIYSMQGSQQENYSAPVSVGQQSHEHPQSNLARNSTNLNTTYTLPTLKPTHLGGNQVPADIQPNGISNAQSLPNLYPSLSPLQSTTHTYIQPSFMQRNNGSSSGLAVGRHPPSLHNRFHLPQPRILDSYEPRLQMTSDLLPSQTFPPFDFGMQNNTNYNLPTSSPMLDQGAWGGNRLPVPTTALNNQVPPGNRANNYWDNFRSYSRQNLLSGTTKTNEASSVPPVYPIADRMVNTVYNTTQTQSTQTCQTPAQTRLMPAKTQSETQPTRTQVRYSSSQKRNLNMHDPEILITNPEANKYSPNTRQDIKRITHRQTRRPYNDIYEMRHTRNRMEKSSELYSCATGSIMAIAVSNQHLSDSSEDNQELSLSESMPHAATRDRTYSVPDRDSNETVLLENSTSSRSDPFQLINVIVPNTNSDEERRTLRSRLLSRHIERFTKQMVNVKRSNRAPDRQVFVRSAEGEDPPRAYETILAAQQVESLHHDDLLSQHWQRIHDPSVGNMGALSLVAEYLARNEHNIIDPQRIEDLVFNVQDKMLHLCNHPQSKWETQHLENFLATLRQELICFIGKKCLDVTGKILANLKSNLYGCFEFSPVIHGPCPDIAIQEFEQSTRQPTSQVNNDRDLAEADQSYSDPFWTMQDELSPILFNSRLRASLAVPIKVPRSSPQGTQPATQTSTNAEENFSLFGNRATREVIETPQRDTYNHGIVGGLDQAPTCLSESHQQPVLQQHNLANTNLSQSHDNLSDDRIPEVE